MKKNILPKNWEISRLSICLDDWSDIDNLQQIWVEFIDEAAGFFPVVTTEKEVRLNPTELKQFAELADKVCKTLDYMSKANFEATHNSNNNAAGVRE